MDGKDLIYFAANVMSILFIGMLTELGWWSIPAGIGVTTIGTFVVVFVHGVYYHARYSEWPDSYGDEHEGN